MILFLDLETTGLDPSRHKILEVAAFLTNDDLRSISTFHRIAIFEPEIHLAEISPVVVKMHTVNGLWALCLDQKTSRSITSIDYEMEKWLHELSNSEIQLAGYSPHFDQSFMKIHMPSTSSLLSRHLIDVTAFDEMARRRWPSTYAVRPQTDHTHRAQSDAETAYKAIQHYSSLLSGD